MNIRRALISDGESISELALQLGYRILKGQIFKRMHEILVDKNQIVFVAEVDGKVIGWIHICGLKRLLSKPFAEVSGFIVDKKHRSVGIGSELLKHAEAWVYFHLIYYFMSVQFNIFVIYKPKKYWGLRSYHQ